MTERSDDVLQVRMAVADLVLAPLAQGEYVLEVLAERTERSNKWRIRFRCALRRAVAVGRGFCRHR